MTTPKKSVNKSAIEDTFAGDESIHAFTRPTAKHTDPFDDDEEFDLPLDDLDGLESFDADDEDEY